MLKTRTLVVAVVALIVMGAITGGAYYYYKLLVSSPVATPTPLPTAPKATKLYVPIEYWDTTLAQGFDDVHPLSERERGAVTFTISRGETGVAVMVVEVVEMYLPISASGEVFNVSFSLDQLPDWVTVTFDPPHFIIGPEQKNQVKLTIAVSPEAPTNTGKVGIFYRMICNPVGTDEKIRFGSYFYLIITD